MSETQLTGLAAIVAKSRKAPEPKQIDLEDAIALTPAPEKTRKSRDMGKSRNPAYARMTVYVPTETRTKAERKWEDATNREKDLSDLAEFLLTKYLAD